ncbi:MAG: hypothetical protein CMG00_09030 [Candidatus Marinimicrobia bacterium]|nr:hypothetical protein [Candidatus Neomarinimicrobiota bacterium]|tara:strand:- start:322 stop:1209 length:888 start_codon:yes stop_codon:yes gene_type:complete
MNVVIIINPNSGKKKATNIFNSIKPILKMNKITFDSFETHHKNHAIDIIKKLDLKKYNAIFMLGGDGTFHEIVTGLMIRKKKEKVPIGIIPTGSGNSFLYDFNNIDPIHMLKKILHFKKRSVDVIKVKTPNDIIYSINLIGWGLVTDIGINAEKFRWLGPSRYTIVSLAEIIKKKNHEATLLVNDKKYTKKFTFIIACNTKYVGKGMFMAPNAQVNDGLLDLIVVKGNLSRTVLFKTLPKLFKGTHITDPNVKYYQIPKFSLKTKGKDLLNIDGELKGTTSIDVEVIKNAIEVFN